MQMNHLTQNQVVLRLLSSLHGARSTSSILSDFSLQPPNVAWSVPNHNWRTGAAKSGRLPHVP